MAFSLTKSRRVFNEALVDANDRRSSTFARECL
jgi:hypothetical protein